MTTAIAKREGGLPQPIKDLLEGIQPVALVKTGAAVGAGFGAAMLGGKLAKEIPQIEKFASGGVFNEIIVDAGAGLILDAVVVSGVYVATKNEHGNEVALKVAKLMAVGTLLGAIVPNVSHKLAEYIDRATTFIVGLFGKKATGAGTPKLPANPTPQLAARGGESAAAAQGQGMSLGVPGGNLYAFAPGGRLYSLSGM